jgi:hypothetical protein
MKDDKDGFVSSHSVAPLQVPGGLALSNSEKAEALVESLEAQYQRVNEPSYRAG